ncbi:DUF2007 domain-containing protein [bacterium BMS3Abin03]|jgi:hypothetical protein|nr:DUF2007 domain-containing protein [bacterium BMS3Abin03]
MGEEFKLLKTFLNPVDANITKGLLESNGIEAFIFDENTLSVDPILTTALGGIRLMVRSSDFENALAIIKEVDKENTKEISSLKCPVCGSMDIKIKNRPNWTYFLIMLLSFVSTPNTGNTKKYVCNACGNRWE